MSFWRKNVFSLEENDDSKTYDFDKKEYTKLHDAIMKLPSKYRVVVHLYYFEVTGSFIYIGIGNDLSERMEYSV